MEEIFDVMVKFFEEDGWTYSKLETSSLLHMAFQGENGGWSCYAQAREEASQFIFYSVFPVNITEEKRQVIAELLTRINYGLFLGNFEMSFTTGEVRYKTSIDVEGEHLTSPLIRQLVYSNVLLMDTYFPAIMGVIYSEVSPEDAIAQIDL